MKNEYLYVLIGIFLVLKDSTQEIVLNVAPEETTSSIQDESYSTTKTWPLFELNGDFLLLSDQLPSCQIMYKKCFLSFLFKTSIDLNNFEIHSSDETKIKVKYFEFCKDFEKHEKCKEVKEFIGYSDQIKIYTIHLEPINFGNAALLLSFDLKNNMSFQKHFLNHSMIITQQDRLEDTLFSYYCLIMETLLSFLLGFTMNTQLIVSTIRHPKSFLISLAGHFVLMPLVNENLTFLIIFNQKI